MATTFTRILVPLDLVGDAHLAVEYAAELARRFDAEVLFLHLYGEADVGATEEALAEQVAGLRKAGIDGRKISRVMDLPTIAASEVILDSASAERADLLVMATHGRRGLSRILLGSVTEEVLRRASCPVLVVHEG